MPLDILDGPDGPEAFVASLGIDRALEELEDLAQSIADATPIDSDDESWDDPQEWAMTAAALAHGLLAVIDAMRDEEDEDY